MAARSTSSQSIPLPLPPAEHWTLHHVLLHRIEQERTAEETSTVEPPPLEIFHAFERLDAGNTQFTIAQFKAIQEVLAEYHHATTWWEVERARIERLLHRVATILEANQPPQTG
ncbi:DUF7853 family protein [Haladaptatus halobius]|uniref:DUF7853 family protein n=1 Tax=Haladaptatus halobius TaxID=2884875 RepID=UPI001D09E905|nr:hypothetical protein [Haladaptatus halobius]